jgi:exoribonuclease II
MLCAKKKTMRKLVNHYWLIGNTIDGLCCHPYQQKMTEKELMDYLETTFLTDFNASRGEFDFTIYLDRQGFRVRQLYGYYQQGPKKSVVAQADYMTADSIAKVVRLGRTFHYYSSPNCQRNRPVLCITLR